MNYLIIRYLALNIQIILDCDKNSKNKCKVYFVKMIIELILILIF